MQVRRAYRAWRRATIAVGLFVLSVLAPAIWREVRLGRESPTATGDVEVVEPQATEELPSPPRLDAYVAPDLPVEEEFAGIARWANVVRETFASRFGQLFAPGDAADANDDDTAAGGDGDLALVVLEAPPPTEEEELRRPHARGTGRAGRHGHSARRDSHGADRPARTVVVAAALPSLGEPHDGAAASLRTGRLPGGGRGGAQGSGRADQRPRQTVGPSG